MSNTSSNDPVIFHFLLLFPVEIPKIKMNLIFVIVANALHFGLCDFIQLAVMSLSGLFKNEHNTQKAHSVRLEFPIGQSKRPQDITRVEYGWQSLEKKCKLLH